MTTPAPPTQALQARVHKLLGSRAELEATKALLGTLVGGEAVGAAPGAAVVAMDAGSGTASLAELRRTLRPSLEEKQLALAETALAGLGATLAHVSALAGRVDSLDAKCASVQRFLETTKRETQQVQAEAAALATKRDEVQGHWKEARGFLVRYQLTEEEVHALYAENLADEDMGGFFATLERVQQVKADCKALVAAGTVNCALELLDAVGKYQEAGFERLYQWTARKCAEVDGEPSSLLHRAIALLRERSEFYNYCKECLTGSRRSLLVRRFIMALTVGGPHGIPRPIEMHAHDPVRYCGDMLAWVHQAIATESEFFRVLFDGDVALSSPPQPEQEDPEEAACASMVGRAFDGVARPLQVRVEQTLGSPHGIVLAYRLVHLLAFYHHKLEQLVPHAEVARALARCRAAANAAFQRQFQQLVDAVAASAQDYAASLAATHTTMDVAHRLAALLEVFQGSLLPEREKEADLAPLFDAVLPALELMCQRSVAGLDALDALIFRINNVSCLQAPLARFPEAAKWHDALGQDVTRWLRELSELQATRVLDRCRVSALLQHMQRFQQTHAVSASAAPVVAAEAPGLDGDALSRVLADFCAALATLLFPQLEHLAQPALADQARALTADALAGSYAFVYAFVHDARHGYVPVREPRATVEEDKRGRVVVVQHTPEEVRTLLELDGDSGASP